MDNKIPINDANLHDLNKLTTLSTYNYQLFYTLYNALRKPFYKIKELKIYIDINYSNNLNPIELSFSLTEKFICSKEYSKSCTLLSKLPSIEKQCKPIINIMNTLMKDFPYRMRIVYDGRICIIADMEEIS